MSKIKEAAFKDGEGHVVGTGPFHNIGELPEDFKVEEEGFLDDQNHFLSRDEAAKEVGISHAVESEELSLNKSDERSHPKITPEIFNDLRQIGIKHHLGCQLASEEIGEKYKLGVKNGAYRLPDGRNPEHYWNTLPDGTVVDATAGQWNEGHEVRVVKPGHPDHSRYNFDPSDEARAAHEDELGLQKSLKEYDFEGPIPDPASATQLRVRALHNGKPVGSLTFAANPNLNERHPYFGYHAIGQADVHPQHRGEGVYGRMLQLAALHVKKGLKSKGLVSRGEWRTDAATGAWQRLAAKNKVKQVPSREPESPDFFMSEKEDTESSPEHIEHEFVIEFNRWLSARASGDQYKQPEQIDLNKAEQDLESFLHVRDANLDDAAPVDSHEVARQMAGYDPESSPEFQAARFLAGGETAPEDSIRVALILYDNDFELAALRAYGLPRNDKYREMLRSVMKMKQFVPLQAQLPSGLVHPEISKGEMDPPAIPRDIKAGNPDAEKVVKVLKRAQDERKIERVHLDPKAKHSKGMSVATDPETAEKWLIKPGSGKMSPAAGAREETANQSLREVAFYKIADKIGLGEFLPEAELILMDGQDVAVMKLLDDDYNGMDKLRQKGNLDPVRLFEPYLEDGTLWKWAFLDWVLGNPDRHANNIMVSKDEDDVKLIDHGSAFAGPSFNPVGDPKSFTPFYLRAWYDGNWSELGPEERFDELPKLTKQRTDEFNEWVRTINRNEIVQILAQYGISQEAVIGRLHQIQDSKDPYQTIMEMWAGLLS